MMYCKVTAQYDDNIMQVKYIRVRICVYKVFVENPERLSLT